MKKHYLEKRGNGHGLNDNSEKDGLDKILAGWKINRNTEHMTQTNQLVDSQSGNNETQAGSQIINQTVPKILTQDEVSTKEDEEKEVKLTEQSRDIKRKNNDLQTEQSQTKKIRLDITTVPSQIELETLRSQNDISPTQNHGNKDLLGTEKVTLCADWPRLSADTKVTLVKSCLEADTQNDVNRMSKNNLDPGPWTSSEHLSFKMT